MQISRADLLTELRVASGLKSCQISTPLSGSWWNWFFTAHQQSVALTQDDQSVTELQLRRSAAQLSSPDNYWLHRLSLYIS